MSEKTIEISDGSQTENSSDEEEELFHLHEIEPEESDEPLHADYITNYLPRGHIKIKRLTSVETEDGELLDVECVETVNDSILGAAHNTIVSAIERSVSWSPEDILPDLLSQEPFCHLDEKKVRTRVLRLWKDLTGKLRGEDNFAKKTGQGSPLIGRKQRKYSEKMLEWLNRVEGLLLMLDGITTNSTAPGTKKGGKRQKKSNTGKSDSSRGTYARADENISRSASNGIVLSGIQPIGRRSGTATIGLQPSSTARDSGVFTTETATGQAARSQSVASTITSQSPVASTITNQGQGPRHVAGSGTRQGSVAVAGTNTRLGLVAVAGTSTGTRQGAVAGTSTGTRQGAVAGISTGTRQGAVAGISTGTRQGAVAGTNSRLGLVAVAGTSTGTRQGAVAGTNTRLGPVAVAGTSTGIRQGAVAVAGPSTGQGAVAGTSTSKWQRPPAASGTRPGPADSLEGQRSPPKFHIIGNSSNMAASAKRKTQKYGSRVVDNGKSDGMDDAVTQGKAAADLAKKIRQRATYKRTRSESSSEDSDPQPSKKPKSKNKFKKDDSDLDEMGFSMTHIMAAVEMSQDLARRDVQLRERIFNRNQEESSAASSGGRRPSSSGSEGSSADLEGRMTRVENSLAEILALLKESKPKK